MGVVLDVIDDRFIRFPIDVNSVTRPGRRVVRETSLFRPRSGGSPLSGDSAAQAGKRRAPQKGGVVTEDQPYQVFEHGLVDVRTREFQRGALETIDIDQDYGHDARLVI